MKNSLWCSCTIEVFTGKTEQPFLHQLVSGQLDVDRLDYLKRDSFFTGVSEGVIGTERIIKMLNVADGQLVVEQKGIYSVEKFLLARRLMYWQVYLHKTVIAAECMLKLVLMRAHALVQQGEMLFTTPAFAPFLRGDITSILDNPSEGVSMFGRLDDYDVVSSMKGWMDHSDPVLHRLCTMLMTRTLFLCRMQTDPFTDHEVSEIRSRVMKRYGLTEEQAGYFVFCDTTSNSAYSPDFGPILVQMKDGGVMELHDVSDQLDFSFHSKMVVKHFLCYPKDIF
jgi:HD superfamily phosphohydrolase